MMWTDYQLQRITLFGLHIRQNSDSKRFSNKESLIHYINMQQDEVVQHYMAAL